MTKRLSPFVLLLLTACIPHALAPQANPPAVKAETPVVVPTPFAAGRKLAVVCGINVYGNGNDLAGCITDAKAWTSYLKSQKRFDEVETLLDGAATADAIRAVCRKLATGRVAGDEIVFVFSGHGTQLEDPNDADGLDEAVCAADVFADFERNCIRGAELRKWLDSIPAGVRVTVWIDACHSATNVRGLRVRKIRHLSPPTPVNPNRIRKSKGAMPKDARPLLAFLAGCTADGTCADTVIDGKPCGAFTHYGMLFLNLAEKDFRSAVTTMLESQGYDQKPQATAGPQRQAEPIFR